MPLHHTFTQQQRVALRSPTTRRRMPAQLDLPEGLWADGVGGTGRPPQFGARSHTHEAKKAIVTEMRELDRPVTSKELYARLDRAWSLKAIEYHLSALVKTKVVEIVFGPELHFRLIEGRTKRSTGSGAASACGLKVHGVLGGSGRGPRQTQKGGTQ